jgi:hypothetical protein
MPSKLIARLNPNRHTSVVAIEQDGKLTELKTVMQVTIASGDANDKNAIPTATLAIFGDLETEIAISSEQAEVILLADSMAALPMFTAAEAQALRDFLVHRITTTTMDSALGKIIAVLESREAAPDHETEH